MTAPRPEHRRLFGTDPAGYDAARPDYPDRVFEILTTRCGLKPGTRTLEIGPGTGTATRRLLSLGADPLVAVEPDERLASYLSETLVGAGHHVEVYNAGFEDIELEPDSFDLIASATAFHWLNQSVAVAKAGRLLRHGGWLANFWNIFGNALGVDEFHEATKHFMEPLGRPAANPDGKLPFPIDADARLADLRAAGCFDEIDHEVLPWLARFTPQQVQALYSTFPNISGLPEAER